jgi:hypothetical protein
MRPNSTCISRLVLASLSLLLACKKDAPETDSPDIRVFTNGAELTDAAVKRQFLARHAVAFRPIAAGPNDKITFIAADTARFSYSNTRYAVSKNGNHYLFYSPYLLQLASDNMLLYDMLKYTRPKAFTVCANGNVTGCYVAQEVRVGTADAKQLTLPCLQYYWSVTQLYMGRSFTRQQQETLFNEFNEAAIAKVPQSDTLAVRTGSINLPIY